MDDPDGPTPSPDAPDENEADDGDDSGGYITRRRLLVGAAVGVGLLGGGGLYVAHSLSGDFGGYEAPATQPMVTTRERLDAADPTERAGVVGL